MPIDLSSYRHVESGLFCRVAVDYYRTTSTAAYTSQVLRFSNYNRSVVINSETYSPLGRLLSITESSSDIRATPNELSITLSGVPTTSIPEIIYSRIKGSPVEIWRVFFDSDTGAQLNITGNPAGRFQGIVNNYSIEDTAEPSNLSGTVSITLACSSSLDTLSNKVSGRRTNPTDQKKFYPLDQSMDRVPNLENSNFNFGVVIK